MNTTNQGYDAITSKIVSAFTANAGPAIQLERVTIAVSGIAFLGAIVQIARHKRFWPYGLVMLPASLYLADGCLLGGAMQNFTTLTQLFQTALADFAASACFPSVAWIIAFSAFQVAGTKQESSFRLQSWLFPVYFGYFWSVLSVGTAIAFVWMIGKIAIQLSTTVNRNLSVSYIMSAYICGLFALYGCWVFFVFFIVQLFKSIRYVRPFIYSLGAFASSLVIVTIGNSITAIPMKDKSNDISVGSFVLTRIVGSIGLYVVLIFGHTWKNYTEPERESLASNEPERESLASDA